MGALVSFILVAPALVVRGFLVSGGWRAGRGLAWKSLRPLATAAPFPPNLDPAEIRWMNRDGVVTIVMDECLPEDAGLGGLPEGESVAEVPGFQPDEEAELHPITTMTLNDIAETYQFSIHYLGDFVCQMGIPPPIDFDAEVCQFLDSEQQSTLMEAVNSLDPFECSTAYQVSLQDLADECGVPIDNVEKACASRRVHLPLGRDTMLHQSLVDSMRSALGPAT